MTDQMRPFYDAARALYPLLPQWYELASDGITPEFRALNAGGLPIFEVPQGYTLMADEGAHEAGHAYQKLLERADPTYDYLTAYWLFRGFAGTWQQALEGSRAIANRAAASQDEQRRNANESWLYDPRESWAEAFARSVVTTHAEKTMNFGKDMNPLLLRAFFTSLHNPSAIGTVVQPAVVVPTPIVVTLPVLLHNSHRAAGKTDGWSGAPGEAQYICDILNPRVVAALSRYGIKTICIDGDMVFHPEYEADYLCFLAPHYDADVYGAGGWFWGRAALSPTHVADDRLGAIIQRRYAALNGPTYHPERINKNVTDYYAFRWTNDKTSGVLVELGVGWGADKDWLRANADRIAQTLADSIAEFAGLEEDLDRNTFNAWFLEEYKKVGAGAKFDALSKQIGDNTTAIDTKANKTHPHTASTTVS